MICKLLLGSSYNIRGCLPTRVIPWELACGTDVHMQAADWNQEGVLKFGVLCNSRDRDLE